MEIIYRYEYDTIDNKGEIYESVLGLSIVHYNKSHDKAIVLVSFSRGKLSGFISSFLLEKEKNEWIIKDTKSLLVS